jgi:hypothetical protein
MRSTRLSRHVGLLGAVALLAAVATPALAVDNADGSSGKQKAATTQHKVKSKKARESSTMSRETPPAYPNLGAPTGY